MTVNEWTAVALSRDVPSGVTRAVILDGHELVIWRAESGAVQVWEDRCPHRGMRLSYGFVRGEALNCLYHGWQYGTSGSCHKVPAHPDLTVPPTIRANAYLAVENGGFIFTTLHTAPSVAPSLSTGRPIASLAIATTPETLHEVVTGTPLDNIEGLSTTLDGVAVNLAWHIVNPAKLMLHAVAVDSGDIETRVLRRLHKLRDEVETRAAA